MLRPHPKRYSQTSSKNPTPKREGTGVPPVLQVVNLFPLYCIKYKSKLANFDCCFLTVTANGIGNFSGGCAPQTATLEQVAAPLSEEELRKLAESITVKVIAKNGAGSGTIIGKQKGVYTVLTNQHVLTPGQPYSIQTPDGKTHTASGVKKADFQGKDLVLLEFRAQEEYAVAALGHRRSFAVGDKVLAAGFPFDSDRPIVSAGKIELLPDKALQGGYRIGYTNDIQQGMSGGPVLNYFGEVTGINGVSAFPILADAYRFEDGSRPSEAQMQQMKRLSWGVPVQILAEVAPEIVAQIPPNPPLKRGGKENYPPFLRGQGGIAPSPALQGR